MAWDKPEMTPPGGGAADDVKPVDEKAGDEAKGSNDKKGIGLRELLIAVLAPTVALIGVAVGVWDNARSEDAARKRDEAIRTAGLVLPYYEEVMNNADAVDFALDECDVAWEAWFVTPPESPEEAAAMTVVDEKCGGELRSAFASLDSSLNQALLVSNDDLEPVVEDYLLAQSEFRDLVEFFESDESLDIPEADIDELDARYNELVGDLATIREDLVEVVRSQVLLQTNS